MQRNKVTDRNFVDMKKMYARLNREVLLLVLELFCEQSSEFAGVAGNTSSYLSCFGVNKGLRQGCGKLLLLFSIYMNGVVRKCMSRWLITIRR